MKTSMIKNSVYGVRFEALKHNDKDRRSYNYKKLKAAGFNSYEANRFKDFSLEKIDSLIAARKVFNGKIKGLSGDLHV